MYSPSWRVQKNHCSVDLVMSVPLRGKLGSNETLILMWFFSKTDEKKNDRFSFCKRSTYSWRLWNYRDAFQFYTVFHPQIVFAFCVYTLSDLVGCLEEAPSRQLTWRTLREVQSKTKASVASWGSLMYLQRCQKVQDVASVKCEILKLQKCPLRELGNTWRFSSTRMFSSLRHMQYMTYTHIFSEVFIAHLFKCAFCFYPFEGVKATLVLY